MSLSASLSSAMSGLDVSSRRAEMVARNVANADRPGYARRGLETGLVGAPGSRTFVARDGDLRLTQLRREAQSREAGSGILQGFHSSLDVAIGDPGAPGSLQDGLALFDAALVAAAADPNVPARLAQVSVTAQGVAQKLNDLDDAVRVLRQDADTDIGRMVDQLNSDLSDVERLNRDILRLRSGGHDAADLLDQRSTLVDRIGKAVPLYELPRDGDTVALVSTGGILLLDGKAATIGFAPRAPITPDMTPPIALSPLSVNGKVVDTADPSGGVRGGALASLFAIRDEEAPRATARLDAMAVELIARFEAPALDATTAPGAVGLFTDEGATYDPLAAKGIAGRIGLNALVAPDRPDQHYRFRDGLGATVPTSGGSSALLLGYGDALAIRSAPTAAGLPDVPASVQGHAAALRSLFSADRVQADDRLGFDRSQAETLVEARDGAAVDIDDEMRRLLQVEQAYAANARVMQAVNEMMKRITEI